MYLRVNRIRKRMRFLDSIWSDPDPIPDNFPWCFVLLRSNGNRKPRISLADDYTSIFCHAMPHHTILYHSMRPSNYHIKRHGRLSTESNFQIFAAPVFSTRLPIWYLVPVTSVRGTFHKNTIFTLTPAASDDATTANLSAMRFVSFRFLDVPWN